MTRLAITSTIIGAAIVAGRLPGVIVPEKYSELIRKFPRSQLWGRILLAACALWAGIIMFNAATDDWSWTRPFVVIGVPLAYWLVIEFANQFLSIRATAGLLLLIAKLALDAADISDKPARLIVTVLAYLWVCAAIWMASASHQVRDVISFFTASPTRCRLACLAGVAIGFLLVALGLVVY